MFCTNCGRELEAHYNVCPYCGASVNTAQTQNTTYTAQPVYTAVETERTNELGNKTLTLGIVGLALAELGLPGLIVSRIGLNKAAELESLVGELSGKGKVGKILSKVGFGLGIGMTIFWILYIIFVVMYGVLIYSLM